MRASGKWHTHHSRSDPAISGKRFLVKALGTHYLPAFVYIVLDLKSQEIAHKTEVVIKMFFLV